MHLPIEPDITRLVDAGLVASDYKETEENGGVVQESVVTFITRPGNPKDITDWDDLTRDDVDVLTPNPFTSGGARWNIMAAYGQAVNNGASEEEALAVRRGHPREHGRPGRERARRAEHVHRRPGRRPALVRERGDRRDRCRRGARVRDPRRHDQDRDDRGRPDRGRERRERQKLLDFLFSEEGQTLFAENGYRPVDEKVFKRVRGRVPGSAGPVQIEEFGGWDKVATEFFDPENGSVAAIERELGEATE